MTQKQFKKQNKDGKHPFKWLLWRENKVRVDKEIAPLISNLWKLGINTLNSCQAHCSFNCDHKWNQFRDKIIPTGHCDNNVWIVFETAKDYQKFLNIVANYNEKKMYEHIIYSYFSPKKYDPNRWATQFFMENLGVEGEWKRPYFNKKRVEYQMFVETGCGKNNFNTQVQLTFPQKHLEYVEKKINSVLKEEK